MDRDSCRMRGDHADRTGEIEGADFITARGRRSGGKPMLVFREYPVAAAGAQVACVGERPSAPGATISFQPRQDLDLRQAGDLDRLPRAPVTAQDAHRTSR